MEDFWKVKKDKINTPHKNKFNTMNIMPALYQQREQKTILKSLSPDDIVVGSYAFNKQVVFPAFYQKRPFGDIDLKSKNPRKTAICIEKNLDIMADSDNYHVSSIIHAGGETYRVHSKAKNAVVADVGLMDKEVPTKRIKGVNYETLQHRKEAVQKMIDDPKAEYRREKDIRMLGYIERYQNQIDSELAGKPNYTKKKRWFE